MHLFVNKTTYRNAYLHAHVLGEYIVTAKTEGVHQFE